MTKVSFFTLGCRVNQAETAVLEEVFRKKGFSLVDDDVPAEIAVINTCTVTGEADHEARRLISRVRRLNPHVRVALIGCQAQVQKKDLLVQPNVHWVVGTAHKMDIADIIMQGLEVQKKLLVTPIARRPFTMPIAFDFGRQKRANLKIQDGCDNFCAYCEVPFARGRARSREFHDVMVAARALADAGHREIVLTGINVGLYEDGGKTLFDVIKGVEKIDGVDRVRLSSVEYAPWVERLAELMRPPHKLCRFLHIPVQSGCDRILARMGRGHTTKELCEVLKKVSAKVKGLMVGADVIVGFPGETDKDFETTVSFLRTAPIQYFHVFSYSHRRRARSRSFKGEISQDVIRERSGRLRALSQEKRQEFLKGLVGLTADVLFEQKKDEHWIGHTDNYVTIKINSKKVLYNQISSVRIVGVDGDFAIGVEKSHGK